MSGIVNSSSSLKALLSILVLSLSLSSCSNKAKPGDCNYDMVTTYAEITDMRPHPEGNGRIAVIMDFKASVLAMEDQEFGKLRGIKVDHDFIVRNNFEIGLKYEVNVSQIIEGDCTPQFVSFNHEFR